MSTTKNKKFNFGNVAKVILLGGGATLRYLAQELLKKNIEVFVFTADRLLSEESNGISFKSFLEKEKINFLSIDKINSSAVSEHLTFGTMGISFGAPWIFKQEVIDLFNGKLINLHSRNLPKNRGAGGPSWMILNRDRESACLLHQVDTGIDTGDIIAKKAFTFPDSCIIPQDYIEYEQEMNKEFLNSFIKDILNNKDFELAEQDNSTSTYFPRLYSEKHAYINWDWTGEEILRFSHAFDDPYCGAITFVNDEKVYLKKCRKAEDGNVFHGFLAGNIYRIYKNEVYVATRDYGLAFSVVLDENKKNYSKLKEGFRFFTPIKKIEEAKKFLAVYNSKGIIN